jgi:glucoside 3-dehydrogenase (cytochrome c) hitch-hiker subunit
MQRREALKNTLLIAGYTVSASTLAAIWESCAPKKSTWIPIFLTPEQGSTLGAIADCILPKTNSPSGSQVGVHRFVDGFISEVFSDAAKKDFVEGLTALEGKCSKENGMTFSACNAELQRAFLLDLDRSSEPFPPRAWGMALGKSGPISYYRQLKAMILRAYFTSEEIGKNFLLYNPIPGEYKACIPLTAEGRVSFE